MKMADDNLQELGINKSLEEKLKYLGYNTIMSIAICYAKQLHNDVGISEAAARKLIDAAREKASLGFESEMPEILKVEDLYTDTGIPELNELLNKGYDNDSITEFFALNEGCLQDVGNILLNKVCKKSCVYVLNIGGFFKDIDKKAKYYNSFDAIPGTNFEEPDDFLHQLFLKLLSDKDLLKEIDVIFIPLLKPIYQKLLSSGQTSQACRRLNILLHTFIKITSIHNIAVVLFNNIMKSYPRMYLRTFGGLVMAQAALYRLYIERKGEYYRLNLVDSPNLQEGHIDIERKNEDN